MWDKEAIKNHKKAAGLICKIKDQCLTYISKNPNCSEFDISTFILNQFKINNLRTDSPPMVALRENTALIHYEPKQKSAKKLRPNSLIMIDLWAGLKQQNAPFADITWMAFYGNSIPDEILKVFEIVKSARDSALSFLKSNLVSKMAPLGMDVYNAVKAFIENKGYGKYRSNYTGHSLGFTSPHGRKGNLNQGSKDKILINQGYALEPEIDFANKFGIRLELDFYMDRDYKFIITTDKQGRITLIGENGSCKSGSCKS